MNPYESHFSLQITLFVLLDFILNQNEILLEAEREFQLTPNDFNLILHVSQFAIHITQTAI